MDDHSRIGRGFCSYTYCKIPEAEKRGLCHLVLGQNKLLVYVNSTLVTEHWIQSRWSNRLQLMSSLHGCRRLEEERVELTSRRTGVMEALEEVQQKFEACKVWYTPFYNIFLYCDTHRIRIKTEEKAKVIAAVWLAEFIQFLATLGVLH